MTRKMSWNPVEKELKLVMAQLCLHREQVYLYPPLSVKVINERPAGMSQYEHSGARLCSSCLEIAGMKGAAPQATRRHTKASNKHRFHAKTTHAYSSYALSKSDS